MKLRRAGISPALVYNRREAQRMAVKNTDGTKVEKTELKTLKPPGMKRDSATTNAVGGVPKKLEVARRSTRSK